MSNTMRPGSNIKSVGRKASDRAFKILMPIFYLLLPP